MAQNWPQTKAPLGLIFLTSSPNFIRIGLINLIFFVKLPEAGLWTTDPDRHYRKWRIKENKIVRVTLVRERGVNKPSVHTKVLRTTQKIA